MQCKVRLAYDVLSSKNDSSSAFLPFGFDEFHKFRFRAETRIPFALGWTLSKHCFVKVISHTCQFGYCSVVLGKHVGNLAVSSRFSFRDLM